MSVIEIIFTAFLIIAGLVIWIFTRPKKVSNEKIELNLHNMEMRPEGLDLRVNADGHSYLTKNIRPDQFLYQYEDAWNRVNLDFTSVQSGHDVLRLTEEESFRLRQRIVLSWICVYNKNNRGFRFLFWSILSPERRMILQVCEQKYGKHSEGAFVLAAHILRMKLKSFIAWKQGDDRFMEMW